MVFAAFARQASYISQLSLAAGVFVLTGVASKQYAGYVILLNRRSYSASSACRQRMYLSAISEIVTNY